MADPQTAAGLPGAARSGESGMIGVHHHLWCADVGLGGGAGLIGVPEDAAHSRHDDQRAEAE